MQKVSTQEGVHQIRINSMRARAAVNFLMYFKTLSTKHFKQTASPGLRSSALVALDPCQVDFLREAAKFSPLRSCRQNPTEAEIKYFILDSTAVRAVQQLNGKVFQLSSGQPSQHQAWRYPALLSAQHHSSFEFPPQNK